MLKIHFSLYLTGYKQIHHQTVYVYRPDIVMCVFVSLSLFASPSPCHICFFALPSGSTLCKDLRLYLSKCFTPGSVDSQLQQVIRENLYLRAVPCKSCCISLYTSSLYVLSYLLFKPPAQTFVPLLPCAVCVTFKPNITFALIFTVLKI